MPDKFIPIYSLDKLSEEQKHRYYLDVCEFLDLPPELGLLEFMYMQNGMGGSSLILYCKRGGTDLIRRNRGISVIELTKDITEGYIIFTAKGRDKDGRTEMAVGAASIKNTGKDLSSQIAVAQTRSIRRMTLQFVGGGILDESEAVSSAVATPQAYQDVQPAPQPLEAPNADIRAATPPLPDLSKSFITDSVELKFSPDMKADIKTRRPKRKGVDLSNGVGWTPLEQVVPIPELTPEPIPEPTSLLSAPMPIDVKKITITEPMPIDIINTPTDLPSQDQLTVFRKKISEYTNTILPQAGMVPTENVGGVGQKVRILAGKMFPDVTDMKNLSLPQWTLFFEFMDGTIADHGAKELVHKINSMIGIVE